MTAYRITWIATGDGTEVGGHPFITGVYGSLIEGGLGVAAAQIGVHEIKRGIDEAEYFKIDAAIEQIRIGIARRHFAIGVVINLIEWKWTTAFDDIAFCNAGNILGRT